MGASVDSLEHERQAKKVHLPGVVNLTISGRACRVAYRQQGRIQRRVLRVLGIARILRRR
jgi:hypothetical protein